MTATAQPEVHVGASVTFADVATSREQQFTIVAPADAAPAQGRLSCCSPVAFALLGHRIGDRVEVRTPRGIRPLLIAAIA
jgi:transcription elongation factor GreA